MYVIEQKWRKEKKTYRKIRDIGCARMRETLDHIVIYNEKEPGSRE